MKKLLLLASLSIFCSNINAQALILTKAFYEPIVGDTSRHYVLDTSAFGTGLNVSLTGSNTVWTYAYLAASSNSIVSAYLDPSAVPASTAYSGCTIVQKQGLLNSFYKSVSSPSTQLEFLGVNSTSLTMNFSNSAISARYPFALGNVINDNFSGTFTFSLSGTSSGNATITADGTGTLNLPSNVTLNNVLRVKSVQSTSFVVTFPPITGSMKQTTYDWYHSSQKYPVLSISYQSISMAGGSPTISAQVLGNKNNFVIGLNEYALNQINANVFPNPVIDILNITSDKNIEQVKIINQVGQVVAENNFQNTINLSHLKSGVYFAEIKTVNGIARKKVIKE